MNNIKLKIISLTLAATTLFSLSSCSLKKESVYNGSSIVSEMNNIDDSILETTITEFIEKVNEANLDINIDWDAFYDRLNNVSFVKRNKDDFILGTYNRIDNIFSYQENDKETINHELTHMLLPYFDNKCLDEGFCQLFLNQVFGYKITQNDFDSGMCKIFCRILDKEELNQLLNGDIEVLKNKLASIMPKYSDAEEYLDYMDEQNMYYREMNESLYNNTNNFIGTDKYDYLCSLRDCIKGRSKIYLKEYYNNKSLTTDNPEGLLREMYEVLNIINYDLYNETINNGVHDNDYFLKDIIDNVSNIYGITTDRLLEIDKESRDEESYRYLPIKGIEKAK